MRGRPAPARTVVIDGKLLPEVLDEAMVHAVVHGFYDEIRKDDLLGPIFNGVIAPQDWPALRFTLHPSLQRLSFAYNVTAIRRALDRGEALPALERFEAPQPHAVWRSELTVRHRRLSDEEAALLARIAGGASFADLCEALAVSHATDAVALHAATLLRTWISDGWIASVTP